MVIPSPQTPRPSKRAERTREALAEALLSLLREGQLSPPAQAIADRAGLSLRSVFHHFEDLRALHEEASRRQYEAVSAMLRPIDPSAPFEERLEAFTAQRAKVLEFISPVRRASLLRVHEDAEVREGVGRIRGAKREETLRTFAAELDALPKAERALAVPLLASLASFDTWGVLRTHEGLSIAKARATVAHGIARILGKETP